MNCDPKKDEIEETLPWKIQAKELKKGEKRKRDIYEISNEISRDYN